MFQKTRASHFINLIPESIVLRVCVLIQPYSNQLVRLRYIYTVYMLQAHRLILYIRYSKFGKDIQLTS